MNLRSKFKIPELLMPAGSLEKLRIAVAYGADAVYAGAAEFSMRPDQASLTVEELAAAGAYTRENGRRLYVALNAMMFDHDMDRIRRWLELTRDTPMDALIVGDAGVFALVREACPGRAIHISTQMGVANSSAARFWGEAGADRVILARECSLEQAAVMAGTSGIDIECFVHGAMCVAVSGRCLLSAHLCGRSGSRGDCKQACRWEWQLVEQKRPGEAVTVFETDKETIFLGSRDLCLIEHIPALVCSGVSALKVEGRMKGEYYVAAVTRAYRAALDAYAADPEGYTFDCAWLEELEAVSHRPYSSGFAFGYPEKHAASLQTHNRPESTCEPLGYVMGKTVLPDGSCDHLIRARNPFSVGEPITWIGPGNAKGTMVAESIVDPERGSRNHTHCGSTVAVHFAENPELPQYAMLRRAKR